MKGTLEDITFSIPFFFVCCVVHVCSSYVVGFSLNFSGHGGFVNVWEAIRLHFRVFASKIDLMVPSYGKKTKKITTTKAMTTF